MSDLSDLPNCPTFRPFARTAAGIAVTGAALALLYGIRLDVPNVQGKMKAPVATSLGLPCDRGWVWVARSNKVACSSKLERMCARSGFPQRRDCKIFLV